MSEAESTNPQGTLSIGLVFETFDTYRQRVGDPPDAQAEYEPIETIEVLEAAIDVLGHRSVRIGSPQDLLEVLGRGRGPRIDVALNIAEGFGSRNREAWAPVLLEMAGVPALGSDALTLSLTLDKAWANRFVEAAGFAIAPQCVLASGEAARTAELPAPFPLFVKPRWEGTAKGILRSSRVADRAGLVAEVERVVATYRQPALVEAFCPGAEYTVTVVGHDPPRALPVVQRALDAQTGIGLHAVGAADGPPGSADYALPGELSRSLEEDLGRQALAIFRLFECRDYARLDFRMDAQGTARFLEINPLPTFAPDGTFGILAELKGRPLPVYLSEILAEALSRLALPVRAAGTGAGGD